MHQERKYINCQKLFGPFKHLFKFRLWTMNTKVIAFVIVVVILTTYVFLKFNVIWTGEKIELKELGTFKLATGIEEHDFFSNRDWLVITGERQRLHWKKSGYNLPAVNFKETFIVLSIHKIKGLYKEDGCDVYTGVPNGFALFDYFNSDNRTYYIYSIPAVWLSQAVG
jgi:hypothetical protein